MRLAAETKLIFDPFVLVGPRLLVRETTRDAPAQAL